MPFSSQVKDELAHQQPRKMCCQIAELSAIIHISGSLHLQGQPNRYALHISTENAAVARKVLKLFNDLFDMRGEVTVRRFRLSDANNYLVYIPENPKMVQSLNELGILDDSLNIKYGIVPRLIKKSCCAVAYLRGLFMGGGFIGDPKGKYHFELSTDNYGLAGDAVKLMNRFDLYPKIRERKNRFLIYLKGTEPMVQFLALIGAHTALLKWEDVRIIKSMRASVNRLVNCDTANLNKSVEAALSQLSDIAIIDEEMGLDNLPAGLSTLARTRLANPEASLEELGKEHDPKLSKSAVYHRIRRIKQLADKFRG